MSLWDWFYDIWYTQLHWIVEVIKLLSQNYVMIHTSDMLCNVIELLSQNYAMIHTFDMVHKHRHFIQIPDKNKCCLFHVCQSTKYKMISHFYFNLHFSDCWKCWAFCYVILFILNSVLGLVFSCMFYLFSLR